MDEPSDKTAKPDPDEAASLADPSVPTVDLPASAIAIDPSKTPKQIYFELLRVWLHHAQMQQQLQTYFPYYLMNNYPQLFQAGTAGPGAGTASGTTGGNSVVPHGGNQAQANQRRAAQMLDPARQEESKGFLFYECEFFLNSRFFFYVLQLLTGTAATST